MQILTKDIIKNFRYLQNQDFVNKSYLEIVFFYDRVENDEKIEKIIKESQENDDIFLPRCCFLNREYNSSNRLEIRDYYTYLYTMRYIEKDNYTTKKIEIIDRANLEDIENKSKENNFKEFGILSPVYTPLLKNETYGKYFYGVSNSLFKILNSINQSFYKKISSGDDSVIDFIRNLNVIKNWENLDELVRREYLRNEIIGRLLYSCTNYVVSKMDKVINKNDLLNNDDFYSSIENIILDDDLLKNAENIDLTNKEVIFKVLELYPYSFDMFRNSDEIPKDYYKKATEEGYYFKEDLSSLNLKNKTKVSNYANYILNNLTIPMIPYEDRATYLYNCLGYYNTYHKTEDNEYLNYFLRGIDTYIRNVNYYDKKIDEYNLKSEKIFDSNNNFSVEEKIVYLRLLIDKFKNQTLNMTLGLDTVLNIPIGTTKLKSTYYDCINTIKDTYIYLQDEFKIDISQLNDTFSTENPPYAEKVQKYYDSNKKFITNHKLNDSEELNEILNYLSLISYYYLEDKKDLVLDKLKQNSEKVIEALYNISTLNKKIMYVMNLYSIQYKIMNLKEFKNK